MNNTDICIVDDNPAVCDALKFLFESVLNLRIKTYHDPILFLKDFPPNWQGCLIVDLFIPSINGIELINELKKINSTIQVIVISGHASQVAGTKALESGAVAFITKPFKTDYLLDKVKEILKFND